MDKTLNGFCLGLWLVQLIMAIIYLIQGVPVSPIVYICSTLICAMHYLEKIFE